MNKSISFGTFLFGVFVGCAAISLFFGNRPEQCVADPTFSRIECCTHISPDGHCAVGQRIKLYNV